MILFLWTIWTLWLWSFSFPSILSCPAKKAARLFKWTTNHQRFNETVSSVKVSSKLWNLLNMCCTIYTHVELNSGSCQGNNGILKLAGTVWRQKNPKHKSVMRSLDSFSDGFTSSHPTLYEAQLTNKSMGWFSDSDPWISSLLGAFLGIAALCPLWTPQTRTQGWKPSAGNVNGSSSSPLCSTQFWRKNCQIRNPFQKIGIDGHI